MTSEASLASAEYFQIESLARRMWQDRMTDVQPNKKPFYSSSTTEAERDAHRLEACLLLRLRVDRPQDGAEASQAHGQ